MPHLDLVFGTHALGRLPALVRRIEAEGCRLVDVGPAGGIQHPAGCPEPLPRGPKVSRFVTIMQGCDNFCTYCVVPHVRGREVSRTPEAILEEVRRLVAAGVREVTLLGQNVNSYGLKEGLCSFADLLGRIDAVPGLERLRFTTSHPKDLSDALVRAFGDLERLCHHIHLPVQSGSNRVLERMNRRYTREVYLQRVARLRAVRPDIAITSDIIVGFPGEEPADFQDTLALVREVEFDGLFAFKYSDRPSAPASRFGDKVPEALKQRRLQTLLALQEESTLRKNQALVGSLQKVLVEGAGRRIPGLSPGAPVSGLPARGEGQRQWTGRTSGFKIVHFCGPEEPAGGTFTNAVDAGMVIDVQIERAYAHSLRGTPARPAIPPRGAAQGESQS